MANAAACERLALVWTLGAEPTGPPAIAIASKRVRDAGRGLKLPHARAGDAPTATATSRTKRVAAGATPAESLAEDMLTLLSAKNYTSGLARRHSSSHTSLRSWPM
jgi:hypothetical protein